VLAIAYHYGYQIAGTKWAAAGDNPTNAATTGNLAATGSWNLVFATTKMVPVARLLVNTPFDLTAYA
jgi:hypothetical protein